MGGGARHCPSAPTCSCSRSATGTAEDPRSRPAWPCPRCLALGTLTARGWSGCSGCPREVESFGSPSQPARGLRFIDRPPTPMPFGRGGTLMGNARRPHAALHLPADDLPPRARRPCCWLARGRDGDRAFLPPPPRAGGGRRQAVQNTRACPVNVLRARGCRRKKKKSQRAAKVRTRPATAPAPNGSRAQRPRPRHRQRLHRSNTKAQRARCEKDPRPRSAAPKSTCGPRVGEPLSDEDMVRH